MRYLVLILSLFASAVYAADATINWSNPTQNTDGTAIPSTGANAIASTRLEWGTCTSTGAFGTKAGERVFNAPATSGTVTGLADGQTFCFRAFSRNGAGNESAASNVVSRAMPTPPPTPRPPVLSSTVTAVWSYKVMGWGETLEVVGSAPLGTPCGAVAVPASGMYDIPVSAVKLDRPLKGGRPVTFCDWTS
jgi:hypothetical protein